jgi:hypothetical protein
VRVVVGGGAGVGHKNRQDCRQCSKQANKNYRITLQPHVQRRVILGVAFLASAHIVVRRYTQSTRTTNAVLAVGVIRVATNPVAQQVHLRMSLVTRARQPRS